MKERFIRQREYDLDEIRKMIIEVSGCSHPDDVIPDNHTTFVQVRALPRANGTRRYILIVQWETKPPTRNDG